MSTEAHQLEPELQADALNPLGKLILKFAQYGQNASNNVSSAVTNMTVQGWLRLVVVVGGYMLMRPYALKWIAKGTVKRMEEEDAKEKAKAKISPNELRGVKQQLESHEEEEEGDGTGADWGQRARIRQREVLKQMIEAEERRREEEEEDKDIQEFLT